MSCGLSAMSGEAWFLVSVLVALVLIIAYRGVVG